MNRLTKYEPNDESMFPYKLKDEELSTKLDSIHKLGRLEDIEDEIGIDLTILFKAQTQGFYIVNVSNKIEKVRLSEWRFNLIKKEVHRVQWNNHLLFADYGKTWALTREELENGNTK